MVLVVEGRGLHRAFHGALCPWVQRCPWLMPAFVLQTKPPTFRISFLAPQGPPNLLNETVRFLSPCRAGLLDIKCCLLSHCHVPGSAPCERKSRRSGASCLARPRWGSPALQGEPLEVGEALQGESLEAQLLACVIFLLELATSRLLYGFQRVSLGRMNLR